MKRTKLGVGVVVAALTFLMIASVAAGAAQYEDGMYIGFSDAGRRGYLMAMVNVQDDKITNVILTEFTQLAEPKDASYPWPQFHEAMEILPGRFVEANSADIDGYSGATGTVDKAKQAVARALERALVNKPDRKYQDGVYYALSNDTDKSTGVAWVTIENGKIVKVEVDELLDDGTWKDWETYPWVEAVESYKVMGQRFVDAQGVDVDIVTGATHSGEKYIQAVEKALRMAEF